MSPPRHRTPPSRCRAAPAVLAALLATLASALRASEEVVDPRAFSIAHAPTQTAKPSLREPLPADYARRFDSSAPLIAAALQRASSVLPMIVAAVHPFKPLPTTADWGRRLRLGTSLGAYADGAGADGEHFETFVAEARRILTKGTTTLCPPEATSRWFDETADAILGHVREIKTAAGDAHDAELAATLVDLEAMAQLARFHARRVLGAVHYNLFRRSLKLGELYAATLEEQRAVDVWRQLVAVVGDRDVAGLGARRFGLTGSWRDELKLLEAGLKDLEEQCCPPDAATLKQSVWNPFR